jgi:hypothetical protein
MACCNERLTLQPYRNNKQGARSSAVVEALCYKADGRGFENR